MKILQLHNRYLHYGGEDAVVDHEHRLLSDAGHEVSQLFFENRVISPLKAFYNRESYRLTKEAIRKFDPEVVHVHNVFYQATPSVFSAARELGKPVVITFHNFRSLCTGALFLREGRECTLCKNLKVPVHGVVNRCFKGSLPKSLLLSAVIGQHNLRNTWGKDVDRIIVLTPYIRELLLGSSLRIKPEQVVVKPNSTDDIYGREQKKAEHFLFVGRLSVEKGVGTLIEAFRMEPELKLRVIGGGPLETELRQKASSNIEFLGMQPKEVVRSELKACQALVQPSIWYEGLPNTILEAFSSGTPVICSDIDNLNQIVSHGKNGLTFKTGNADSLREILNNSSGLIHTDMYYNARREFEEKYSHKANLQSLEDIYGQLL